MTSFRWFRLSGFALLCPAVLIACTGGDSSHNAGSSNNGGDTGGGVAHGSASSSGQGGSAVGHGGSSGTSGGQGAAPVTTCGNGTIEAGESCDGADLGGASCAAISGSTGTPKCTASCTIDYGPCACPAGQIACIDACTAEVCALVPSDGGPFTIDSTNIYWSDVLSYGIQTDHAVHPIFSQPLTGGAKAVLYPDVGGGFAPVAFAAAGTTLVFSDPYVEGLFSLPITGGTPKPFGGSIGFNSDLRGGSAIFAHTQDDTGLVFLPDATEVANVEATFRPVANADTIFYGKSTLYDAHLSSMPFAGGKATTLFDEQNAEGVVRPYAADATNVYVLHELNGASTNFYPTTGVLWAVPIAGAHTPVVLFTFPMNAAPTDFVVDATNVYWLTSTSLMRAPLAGGAATLVVMGKGFSGLLADDAALYWLSNTNAGGAIMKLAK